MWIFFYHLSTPFAFALIGDSKLLLAFKKPFSFVCGNWECIAPLKHIFCAIVLYFIDREINVYSALCIVYVFSMHKNMVKNIYKCTLAF